MNRVRLVPLSLALAGALLFGACTSETNQPSASAPTAPTETPIPTASVLGAATMAAPTATPTPKPQWGYVQVFDVSTGQQVRTLAPAYPSGAPAGSVGYAGTARDARGMWVRTAVALELQTFDGRVVDRLLGDWWPAGESPDQQTRYVFTTDSCRTGSCDLWAWSTGEPAQRVQDGFGRSFSPNGLFVSYVNPGSNAVALPELWVADTTTWTPRLVGIIRPCQCDVGFPEGWSPDGRYLAFIDFAPGARASYLYDSANGSTRRLDGQFGGWSPTGTSLLVRRGDSILLQQSSTGREQALAVNKGFARFISPFEVLIRPTDFWANGFREELLDLRTMATRSWNVTNVRDIRFSPDALVRLGDRLLLSNANTDTCRGTVMFDNAFQEIRCLPDNESWWSPDGRAIATVRGAFCLGPSSLMPVSVTSLDDGSRRLLGEILATSLDLTWSHDSRYLAVKVTGCGQ